MSKPTWTWESARDLVRRLESMSPRFGGHIALTGGVLYKDGERRDLDLLIYRIRQEPYFDWQGFFGAMEDELGIKVKSRHGWVVKCEDPMGRMIDFFNPEYGGDASGDGY